MYSITESLLSADGAVRPWATSGNLVHLLGYVLSILRFFIPNNAPALIERSSSWFSSLVLCTCKRVADRGSLLDL